MGMAPNGECNFIEDCDCEKSVFIHFIASPANFKRRHCYAPDNNIHLTKAMIAMHGEAACSKDDCRQAIRLLIDPGQCVYAYLGGSYIQLPPKEEAQ